VKYEFIEPAMGVANWRTVWPAKELRRRGWDVDIYASGAARPTAEAKGEITTVLHFVNKVWNSEPEKGADGRPISCLDIVSMARESGPVFITFDDDWTRLLEIERKPYNPLAVMLARQIPLIAALADRVIVSTPRLAEVFGEFNADVRVAENYLPREIVELSRRHRRDVVAWMGVMDVHGMDWNLIRPYASDLPPLRLIGSHHKCVLDEGHPGKCKGPAQLLMSWGARSVEATPPTLDQRHLYRMLGEARAAIIPLADTSFNRGKSWIKPMEFIARGVQPVASWHPEYERLNALIGGVPTYRDPADLVAATVEAYERGSADDLSDRLDDFVMETKGGDAWERALENP